AAAGPVALGWTAQRPGDRGLDRRPVAGGDAAPIVEPLLAERRHAIRDHLETLAAGGRERAVAPPSGDDGGIEAAERSALPLAVVDLDQAGVDLDLPIARTADRRPPA